MKKGLMLLLMINFALLGISQKKENSIFEKGIKKYENKKYEKALICFNKIISKDSNNYEAYYYVGLCRKFLSQYENAYSDFKKAISLGYHSPEVFIEKIQMFKRVYTTCVYCSLRDSINYIALSEIDSIIKSDSTCKIAYYYKQSILGDFYTFSRNKDSLSKEILLNSNKVLQIDTTFSESYFQRAIATIMFRIGTQSDTLYWTMAIKDISMAIAFANPKNNQIRKYYYMRAYLKCRIGDIIGSNEDYKKAYHKPGIFIKKKRIKCKK